MKEDERKSVLRSLSPDEYRDVMNVCATLPHVILTIRSEGRFVPLYTRREGMFFFATFNNISVLLVEETGIPGENHLPATSH